MTTTLLWILLVINGTRGAEVIARFKDEAACNAAQEKIEAVASDRMGNSILTMRCIGIRGAQ